MSAGTPLLSIITTTDPVARQLPRLLVALDQLAAQQSCRYQVIMVDDLGQWQSEAPPLAQDYPSLILLPLQPISRQGQTQAILHGIRFAGAPYVLTIDPDLHPCVVEIPAMMAQLGEHVVAVHGHRSQRSDIGAVRQAGSIVANLLMRLITGLAIPDIGSPVTLFDRHVLEKIILPDQVQHNPRLYVYATLGRALAVHQLQNGSPSHSPSQYSLRQLINLVGRLLIDSYQCRRLLSQRQP